MNLDKFVDLTGAAKRQLGSHFRPEGTQITYDGSSPLVQACFSSPEGGAGGGGSRNIRDATAALIGEIDKLYPAYIRGRGLAVNNREDLLQGIGDLRGQEWREVVLWGSAKEWHRFKGPVTRYNAIGALLQKYASDNGIAVDAKLTEPLQRYSANPYPDTSLDQVLIFCLKNRLESESDKARAVSSGAESAKSYVVAAIHQDARKLLEWLELMQEAPAEMRAAFSPTNMIRKDAFAHLTILRALCDMHAVIKYRQQASKAPLTESCFCFEVDFSLTAEAVAVYLAQLKDIAVTLKQEVFGKLPDQLFNNLSVETAEALKFFFPEEYAAAKERSPKPTQS